MTSKIPMVRQINWISLIMQIVILALLMRCLDIYLGIIIYYTLFFSIRFLFIKNHKKGVRLLKRNSPQEAIDYFQLSYDFFNRHTLLNKCIPLLTASKITYKEMSLLNIAYCYIMLKDGKTAMEYYNRTLEEFPNSMMAKNSLNVIDALKNIE